MFGSGLPKILAAGLFAFGVAGTAAAQEEPSLTDLVEMWLASPHGDYQSESFTHWHEDGAVPEDCAACHSGPGFIDYVGGDGTAAGVVDHPAPNGVPVDCVACHNAAAEALDAVTMPSGEEFSGLGSSAQCMVCHQGRQSTDSVNERVASIGEDTVDAELGFVNIHYRASAATLLGAAARGGYQYEGRDYAGRFTHVPSANTCTTCHDPHTTQVDPDGCLTCHQGVDELRDIRTRHQDFDGDGDTAEGIHGEIMTLHAKLGDAIQAYAAEVAEAPVVYDSGAYPYFFADSDGDGSVSEGEATYPNRYQSWTPRLLKAAYNYQFAAKDPGGYTHNPQYMLQLLHDSLASLGEAVEVDMAGLTRP